MEEDKDKETVENKNKRQSRTLIPPESHLNNSSEEIRSSAARTELSTPKKQGLEKQINYDARSPPSSNELDPIELNIVNLESDEDLRLQERARSSPSIRGLVKEDDGIGTYRKTSSTTNIPKNAEDPEDRVGHGRQYSLNLGPAPDHVVVEIEQERKRKSNERNFKIIIGLFIFGALFTVTFFMIAWEMGYLNEEGSFSTPVFY